MIEIIFENEHFVICDKLSGVLSTPSRFEDQDERKCLGSVLQAALNKQIYPVHRLDFEVSGLVMFAKSPEAHRQANSWFEKRQVHKTYRALTTGQDFSHIPLNIKNARQKMALHPGINFNWEGRILRGKRRAFESPHGKSSLTLVAYIGVEERGFHKWDLHPVTGRSHQLRFDLSRHGFPIVGDQLYGSKVDWKGTNSIALRAYEIDFEKTPGAEALGLPAKIRRD